MGVLAWLFGLAYGPTDATATPTSWLQSNPEWFILLAPACPGCPGKEAIK